MGSIVKGVGSLFGGRARRREQKTANKEFDKSRSNFQNFQFDDVYYEDIQTSIFKISKDIDDFWNK